MDHHNQTEKHGRGRALLAAAASLVFIVVAASIFVSSNSSLSLHGTPIIPALSSADAHNNQRRDLSVALPGGGCKVTYAKLSSTPIAPTWQASFPGSGARMTWSLIEALTGIRTNDDYDSHERGYEYVVAVKTHYPVKDARHHFLELDTLFGRAMVILRNPMNAIPSYFNLQYEHQHQLPNHSTRGPNEDWIKYRDNENYGVFSQIYHYERFVEYWMEKYPERRDILMVSYEDLTDNDVGSLVAMRIANFLAETEGVNPIAQESVPCVWETIVNYKNVAPPPDQQTARRRLSGKTFADPSSLRTGPKVRPYTEQNLLEMVAMFQRLMEKYSYDQEFGRIMVSYIETVSSTAPQD